MRSLLSDVADLYIHNPITMGVMTLAIGMVFAIVILILVGDHE